MTIKNSLLCQLSIPTPCSADWSDLVGDGRRRYCEQCDKNVYDLSKMTATEVAALLATLQGRVCATITWQTDGSVLTEDPLPILPVARRRASPFASVAVTTLITITASPAGGPPAQAASIVQSNAAGATPIISQLPHPAGATASIAGTIFDHSQAVIAGARVSLISQATGETLITTSSDVGEFYFAGLSEGAFTVRVESRGFATSNNEGVNLAAGQKQQLDVTMQVQTMGEVVSSGVVVMMPKPLRALYNESDLIVVARIGESKSVEREGEAQRLKTTLHVSLTLKGKSKRSTVDLYHWNYGDLKGPFVAGKELLLFLKTTKPEPGRKPRGGYEIADSRYGIKHVTGRELRAYLDRIEELSNLSPERGPIDAAIVEWLVRCAEDPATRWEGASELVANIDRDAEETDDEDSEAESTTATSAETDREEQEPGEAIESKPDSSALLTAEQKTRLMTALFKTERVQDGDLELIELARRWNEPRLVPFLIEQLHRLEANPPRLAERLMDIVATKVNDEKIKQLAESYQDDASYPDEDVDEKAGEARAGSAGVPRDDDTAAAIETRRHMLANLLQAVEALLAERKNK